MANGANGVISVLSNVYPEETQEMCAAALKGDYETAGAIQRELLPLIDLLFCEVNPIPVKAAMKCIGYDCGDCRLPLCKLTQEHQKQLEAYFA
jgi:4-hydroxy-tetrahydrodipicolinate synthase